MFRLSSNITLLLKIFLPTFWLVFFGLLTLAVLLSNAFHVSFMPQGWFKLLVLFFFLAGCVLFYFTVIQLKRVEVDDLYLYISNYFSTYRYPYHNIDNVSEKDLGIVTLMIVYFKKPGKFGKRVFFLLDKDMLQKAVNEKPEIALNLEDILLKRKAPIV
jgi:hypothetical protein